ncbi:neutral/alkaline non-lysosomal ceramidase C-terminal domain-containing protein [Nocardia sp. NPDC058518]|uniref:neutral/alkaline non-lysosomal ceramidase C-terminal domain-containing protein n=1 Tax=Nocardia sp. NPDC058518 TaxID=3346534 RepID=UPI00364FA290
MIDLPAPGTFFGQLTAPVAATVARGAQAVAGFSGANPNNNLRRYDTYLTVDRRDGGSWTRVADDSDWSTKIFFDNVGPVTGVRITWDVPGDAPTGTYRITYRGDSKAIGGKVSGFTGPGVTVVQARYHY